MRKKSWGEFLTPDEKKLHQTKLLVRSYENTIKELEKTKKDTKKFKQALGKAKAKVTRLKKKVKDNAVSN